MLIGNKLTSPLMVFQHLQQEEVLARHYFIYGCSLPS